MNFTCFKFHTCTCTIYSLNCGLGEFGKEEKAGKEGKEKEKEGRKERRKGKSQIQIPKEKANYKNKTKMIFLF